MPFLYAMGYKKHNSLTLCKLYDSLNVMSSLMHRKLHRNLSQKFF